MIFFPINLKKLKPHFNVNSSNITDIGFSLFIIGKFEK